MKFNKSNYILSFRVQGVSVFVTDIHVDVYKELKVLFLIDNGNFKQYFAKDAFNEALDRGLRFYSDKDAFGKYKKELSQHCASFRKFFNEEIEDKQRLTKKTTQDFFDHTIKLCKDYTWMNFEHTDKAFSQQENNLVLKSNLQGVSKFKDEIREYMNEVLFNPSGYTEKLFNILGKQFGLTPNQLNDLTQKEILDLFDSIKTDLKAASSRQKAFVINFDRSEIHQGDDAQNILKEFREERSSNGMVSGKTASSGKVRGRVKIINVDYADLGLLNKEIAKMEKGDVLIAETTAPELIVACRKAAAIVTDIGGLLSHAAIVSREFGIPCIVGTESATKVFKDGDMVEVDGEKGTVTLV